MSLSSIISTFSNDVIDSRRSRKNTFPDFDEPKPSFAKKMKYAFTQEREEIFSLLALAEPVVDITSEISSDIIQKYNLKFGDSVLVDEKDNDYTTEVYKTLESMPSVTYIPGGSVENTARVLSWCLNMEQNMKKKFKVSILGALGDDNYKNKIQYALRDIGVNPILQIIKNDKTSRCGVGIYKKEKLFITQIRASKRLSEEFIYKNRENIYSHDAVLIEGYMLNNRFDICKKICENFKKNNKKIILTLSATFIIKFQNEKLLEIANNADIIAGNMDEALELSDHKSNDNIEIFEIIFKKLEPKENRLLVITDGPNGVYCGKYNYEEKRMDCFWTCSANKLRNDEIQDLNGAGDAFLGGFLSQYMKGYSIQDCCKIGIEASTVIIKNVGCTFPKKMNLLYC